MQQKISFIRTTKYIMKITKYSYTHMKIFLKIRDSVTLEEKYFIIKSYCIYTIPTYIYYKYLYPKTIK
jgi:hypothetical protein